MSLERNSTNNYDAGLHSLEELVTEVAIYPNVRVVHSVCGTCNELMLIC